MKLVALGMFNLPARMTLCSQQGAAVIVVYAAVHEYCITCMPAPTNDFADLLVHLLQLVGHLPAVNTIRVASMVYSQVVSYQHVPAARPRQ